MVIDEVQRVPDLLLVIKQAVDRDTSPGRFLLPGSANVLTNRRVKDALTGRMELIRLWPLSQSEVHGSHDNVVDALFAADPPQIDHAVVGRPACSWSASYPPGVLAWGVARSMHPRSMSPTQGCWRTARRRREAHFRGRSGDRKAA